MYSIEINGEEYITVADTQSEAIEKIIMLMDENELKELNEVLDNEN